ncbi:unnamed protein product [Vicia faba]|uniref:Pentatricopeptide repeat-containing protein n=1 Tax=Vicia faba TaxID=3906 RepID=A0AAV1A845_VICFA|nr:unnamed protein product [Vicia faba]
MLEKEKGREEGKLVRLVTLLKRLLQKNLIGDSVAYLLIVCVMVRLGDLGSALEMYNEMVRRGFSENSFVYNSFIEAFCEKGKIGEAIGLMREMEGKGRYEFVIIGCLAFDKVVEKLGENGDVEKVKDVLTVLFLPSNVTYSHLIRGYARNDKVQDVLKIYYEMEYKSLCPGLSVYSSMIQCLCRFGKVEDAEKYLRIMNG